MALYIRAREDGPSGPHMKEDYHMATDTTTAAAAPQKKRAAFTRTVKPVYIVLNYTDEQGQAVKLDKSRLSVVAHKDAAAILEAVEAGGMGDGIFMKLDMPGADKPAAAPAAA